MMFTDLVGIHNDLDKAMISILGNVRVIGARGGVIDIHGNDATSWYGDDHVRKVDT